MNKVVKKTASILMNQPQISSFIKSGSKRSADQQPGAGGCSILTYLSKVMSNIPIKHTVAEQRT